MKKVILNLFAVMALFAVVACSKSSDTPEEAYMAFWENVAKGDFQSAASLVNDADEYTLQYIKDRAPSLWERYYVEVTNVEYTPEKDRAFISLDVIERDSGDREALREKISMTKTEDGWKLDELDL